MALNLFTIPAHVPFLDALAAGGFVQKQKIGRGNYYINLALNAVLQGKQAPR